MHSLLVTGATGFVGRNLLIRAAAKGIPVLAPVRSREKLLRCMKEDPVGKIDRLVEIVGDEQDRDVHVFPDFQKIRLHLGTGLGVQGPEWLVHEEDPRAVRQRTGNRHPLLHAAGKLVRVGVFKFRQADQADPLPCLGLRNRRRLPRHAATEHYILFHGQPREQGVTLEDHSPVGPRPRDTSSVEQHFTRSGRVQPGQDPDECRLPASRGTEHAEEFPAVNLERNPVQRRVLQPLGDECPRQGPDIQHHRTFLQFGEPRGNFRRLVFVGVVHAGRGLRRESSRVRRRPGPEVFFCQGKILRPITSSTRSVENPMIPMMMMAAKTLS